MKKFLKSLNVAAKSLKVAVKDNPKTTVAGVSSIILGASVILNEPEKVDVGIGEIIVGLGLLLSADSVVNKED